jgi:hypothetical protein
MPAEAWALPETGAIALTNMIRSSVKCDGIEQTGGLFTCRGGGREERAVERRYTPTAKSAGRWTGANFKPLKRS